MAERRMFAKSIIDSDSFLDMPLSTQALYFHLGMRADDDGFVNSPKRIQRLTNCSDDDLKLLIAKKFIIPFENGIVVIKHWKIHNYIPKDRYHETNYTEEKSMLETKENGSYALLDTPCIQDVYKMDTEVRIGKVSQGKVSQEEGRINICPKPKALREEFENLWSLYPRKQGKDKAYGYYERARRDGTTYEEVEQGINDYRAYIQTNHIDMQYVKHGSTFFSQKAWQDDWTVILGTKKESRRELFERLIKEHEENDI